jgi:phosphoribosylamine--glycine ligase
MLVNKQFGEASSKVVIEQFLSGIEVSVFALTNGMDYQIIGHAKDYKRIGEGDTGLNTGGMGCVSPVPFMDDTFMQKVEERIVKPTINGLAAEELCYNGFVFFGLMNVDGEPFVIEYNCRMGDPETEVVMPRLQTDLVALFAAMDNGTLIDANITYDNRSCATIMAVSGGYPGDYEKNKVITGLEDASAVTDTLVFQAGTKTSENAVVTSGGRVLAVTAFGNNIKDAVALAHQRLEKIRFEGIYFGAISGTNLKINKQIKFVRIDLVISIYFKHLCSNTFTQALRTIPWDYLTFLRKKLQWIWGPQIPSLFTTTRSL